MYLSRSAVVLLALAALAPDAHAGRGGRTGYYKKSVDTRCMLTTNVCHFRVAAPAGDIASVTATLSSAGGDEDLTLVESDTLLHGTAAIAALPAKDAALTVTLYDTASAALSTYSGTLGADGRVTLTAEKRVPTDGAACASRTGCTDGEPTGKALDVELLSAEVYPASSGYDLALDLGGADTFDVAYADVRYTPPCDLTGERGICLSGGKTVTAEVGWDDIASVWEAELTVAHAGAIDARVQLDDAAGHRVDTTRATVGLPWSDGDDGVGVLPVDGDARTRVGFLYGREGARIKNVRSMQLAVVSDGWTQGDALPTHAEIALDDGTTVTIPANSYQRLRKRPELLTAEWDALLDDSLTTLRVVVDGRAMTIDGADLTPADLSSPLCAEGVCVTLVPQVGGGHGLSVTQYHWSSSFPTLEHVSLEALDGYGKEGRKVDVDVTFDDEVSVVFATEVGFAGDPVDAAFTGRVRLLGEADRTGKQDTLEQGSVYGALAVDAGGDLAVGGVAVDDVASKADTNFAVLIVGEPSSCGDDDSGYFGPPPLASVFGNGSGTKNATTTTSSRPQLL